MCLRSTPYNLMDSGMTIPAVIGVCSLVLYIDVTERSLVHLLTTSVGRHDNTVDNL